MAPVHLGPLLQLRLLLAAAVVCFVLSLQSVSARKEEYCVGWPLQISMPKDMENYKSCTVLYGSLEIRNIVNNPNTPLPKLRLVSITGYLVISGVRGFQQFSQLLPDLNTIFGFKRVPWSRELKSLSLGQSMDEPLSVSMVIRDTTLTRIDRNLTVPFLSAVKEKHKLSCPSVAIFNNPLLCGLNNQSVCANPLSKDNFVQVTENGQCQICFARQQTIVTTFIQLPKGETPWVKTANCPDLTSFSHPKVWKPEDNSSDCGQAYSCRNISIEWNTHRELPCSKDCPKDITISAPSSVCQYPVGCTKVLGEFSISWSRGLAKGEAHRLSCYNDLASSVDLSSDEALFEDVLRASFGQVKSIESTLTITDSIGISALSFLPSLEQINGRNARFPYTVIISSNNYLSDLGFLKNASVTIERSQTSLDSVFITNNANLCPDEVEKVRKVRPMINTSYNGGVAACLVCMHANFVEDDQTFQWKPILTSGNCSKEKDLQCWNESDCYNYYLYWTKLKDKGPRNLQALRSPCNGVEDGWDFKAVNHKDTTLKLQDLVKTGRMQPCINYWLVICAYSHALEDFSVISPARTDFVKIKSPPRKYNRPIPPRSVIVRQQSDRAVVSWEHISSNSQFRVRYTLAAQLSVDSMNSARATDDTCKQNDQVKGRQGLAVPLSCLQPEPFKLPDTTERVYVRNFTADHPKFNRESSTAEKCVPDHWNTSQANLTDLKPGEFYVIEVQTLAANTNAYSTWTIMENNNSIYFHQEIAGKQTTTECKITEDEKEYGWHSSNDVRDQDSWAAHYDLYELRYAIAGSSERQDVSSLLESCPLTRKHLPEGCRRLNSTSHCLIPMKDSSGNIYNLFLICRNSSPICYNAIREKIGDALDECEIDYEDPSFLDMYEVSGYTIGSNRFTLLMEAVRRRSASDGSSNLGTLEMVVIILIVVLAVLFTCVLALCQQCLARKKTKTCPYSDQYGMPQYVSAYEVDANWEVMEENVKILRELGQGQFGMVYEGFYTYPGTTTNVKVAIKTAQNCDDKVQRNIFLQEASVMKKFNSPYITRLLGIVSMGEKPMVLMEFLAHGDLKAYLRAARPEERRSALVKKSFSASDGERPLPEPERFLQWALHLSLGMSHLETKKFVHRDLAARNCMLSENLTLKVGDFGLTRDIYESDYYRKKGHGMLPLRWLSPEALRDGVYLSASDVWSYGVVLWEMATLGELPYQGKSNEEVLDFVVSGGRMPIPITTHDFPEELGDLMEDCWQVQADQRPTFTSITELLRKAGALERLANDEDCEDVLLNSKAEIADDLFVSLAKPLSDYSHGNRSDRAETDKDVYDDPLM